MSQPTFNQNRPVGKRALLFLCLSGAASLFFTACETTSPPGKAHVQDTSHTFNTVVVDAGHGGMDSGVVHHGIAEKNAALDVAKRLDEKLRAAGFNTVMTRKGDYFVELNERAAISNRQTNSIFVSVHFNDCRKRRIRGVDAYYNSDPAAVIAGRIEHNLSKIATNRGIHSANFRVLRLNKYPAVLVECGFLSNGNEAGEAKSSNYREKIATLIAQAITEQRHAGGQE